MWCSNLKSVIAIAVLLICHSVAFPVHNENSNASSSSTDHNNDLTDSPSETQSAQCTITSGDIKASAQATITKTLEGVCGTNDMITAFQTLESRLMYELYNIRLMIGNPQYQQYPMNQQFLYHPLPPQPIIPLKQRTFIQNPPNLNTNYDNQHTQPVATTFLPQLPSTTTAAPRPQTTTSQSRWYHNPVTASTNPPTTSTSTKPTTDAEEEDYLYEDHEDTDAKTVELQKPSNVSTKKKIELKSLDFKPIHKKEVLYYKQNNNQIGPREHEIHKFNNTIITAGEAKIFTYFWKIENYTKKLETLNVTTITSPVFTISGLNLRVRGTVKNLNRDYFNLQLEKVTKEILAQTKSNVILATGNMFQAIEPQKLFRHKIIIMDQNSSSTDLISQEFWDTNSGGFQIPNDVLINSFSKDDSILIKVNIYLY